MIAAAPQVLVDAAAIIVALAAIVTGLVAIAKFPPTRWLVKNALVDPVGEWVIRLVSSVTDPIWERIKYHLGTNGDTMPIHERIARLEQAHGLEPVQQHPEDDE